MASRDQHLRAAHSAPEMLDAVRDVFDANAYHGFSLRGVAERIGYSPTTIYLYIADKDALLAALLDDGFDLLLAALARPHTTPDAVSTASIGRRWC